MNNLLISSILFKKLLILLNPFLISLIYHNLKPITTPKERVKDAKVLFFIPSILGIIIIIFGQHLLRFFDINTTYVKLAGGVMITLTAWKLLQNDQKFSQIHNQSIVVPMVVPICIGGSTLSIILTTIAGLPFEFSTVFFLSATVVLVYFIIASACFFSKKIINFFHPAIIEIMAVLSAFIVFCIGINILVTSLKAIW